MTRHGDRQGVARIKPTSGSRPRIAGFGVKRALWREKTGLQKRAMFARWSLRNRVPQTERSAVGENRQRMRSRAARPVIRDDGRDYGAVVPNTECRA